MKACYDLGIKQVFAGPILSGNADTERVIGPLKEELIWPYNWDHPFDFQRALEKWIDNYN
jgi:putative transposase